MRFLRTNTAVIITVGPFLDATDGVTLETALTITNERITLTADTDDGNAPTNILDNVTGATSGTANDLNYITGNDAGLMQLELAAADTNRVGRMFLTITDAANHVPVFHEFMVLPAMIYDSFIAGTGALNVNVSTITNNAITANAINADAITAAKVADGAIDAATFAAGAINAAAIADGAIDAATFAAGAINAAAVADGAIDAATFAAGAINAAAIADGAIDAATFAAGAITAAAIATDAVDADALAADALAEIKTQAVAALNTDTYAEPGQGAPAATTTLVGKIGYLYKAWRNKSTQTADTYTLYNDDTTTAGQKATFSDDATTATRGEIGTGA